MGEVFLCANCHWQTVQILCWFSSLFFLSVNRCCFRVVLTGTIRGPRKGWVGGYEVYTKTTHSVLKLLMAVCPCPETFGEFNSVITLPHPSLHSFCAPVCVCEHLCAFIYMCVCIRTWGIQYYDDIIYYFWGVNVYITVDLVKHGVPTLVSEIWHYTNDCYNNNK